MATRNGRHATKTRRPQRVRSNGTRLRKQAIQVGDDIHAMGTIARHAAQAKFDELRDNAAEYYELGREKMGKVERTMERYICEQPVKSILIAAGVGLFIGRFLMRR